MVLTQRLYAECGICQFLSFHTTMVLTQQIAEDITSSVVLFSFHTTMVLTQRNKESIEYLGYKYVSIPLWFSRNVRAYIRSFGTPVSFHTTMVLTQLWTNYKASRSLLVSIPLWFSRNRPRIRGRVGKKFRVSIPLWFSRNGYIYSIRRR